MTKIRRKARGKSEKKKEKFVLSNLTTGTLITAFAYLTLISYTWPMGFIPIVSLESLPIVLLGFIIFSIGLIGISLAVSFPFSLPAYHFFKLRKSGFSFKNIAFWRALVINIWASLFGAATIKGHRFMTFIYILGLFIGVLFFWLIFIVLVQKLGWGIGLWCFIVGFYMAVMLADFGRKDFKWNRGSAAFYTMVSLVIFLWLPVLISTVKDKEPNFLVQAGLAQVKLGGGIPASIYSGKHDIIEGNLIFYDGKKAWVQQCETKEENNGQGIDGAVNNSDKQDDKDKSKNSKQENGVAAEAEKTNDENKQMKDKSQGETVKPVVTEVVVSKIVYYELNYDVCQKGSFVTGEAHTRPSLKK